MQIIVNIIIIALFNCGLKILMWEGMLLHGLFRFFDDYIKSDIVRYWMKPIVFCVVCFSSFWGSVVLYSIGQFDSKFIITCIGAIPVTLYLYLTIDRLNN